MKKRISWRIKHAERKIAEGKKINKFQNMLMTYKRMIKEEIAEGFKYVHQKGDKNLGIPQSYLKIRN